MVRKGTFYHGDLAIYFEIDSHVNTTKPEFAFLEKKHGNIKTQKYTFGGKNPGFYSQGLLMSAKDFGGMGYQDGDGQFYLHFGKDSYFKENIDFKEGDFLTEKLGVTYAEAEEIAKSNFGYFAGYYDEETCAIIYDTYQCSHPIFGDKPFDVSPEEAFKKGMEIGKNLKR